MLHGKLPTVTGNTQEVLEFAAGANKIKAALQADPEADSAANPDQQHLEAHHDLAETAEAFATAAAAAAAVREGQGGAA